LQSNNDFEVSQDFIRLQDPLYELIYLYNDAARPSSEVSRIIIEPRFLAKAKHETLGQKGATTWSSDYG
jgi:hypothetical protein